MTGYMCKYAPVEILAGFGVESELLVPTEAGLDLADGYIFPSVCSYAKAVLQHTMKSEHAAVLFTVCCDAMKRVADVLANETEKSIYRIDLPRLADERGRDRYAAILERFVLVLEEELGTVFDEASFLAACNTQNQEYPDSGYIALLGARIPPSLLAECEALCRLPVRDLTCSAQYREFYDPPKGKSRAEILHWYAGCLLDQTPCMRMADTTGRKALVTDPRLKGIIYHTIKFCDFYSFEYAAMERLVPVLKLETDFTPASAGQLRTRLEAFFEATGTQKEVAPHRVRASESAGCYAGIDIGSTSTDAVLLDGDGRVLAQVGWCRPAQRVWTQPTAPWKRHGSRRVLK